MVIAETEHDKIMIEIMKFTQTVVCLAGLKNVDVHTQAQAIFMAERVFHKVVMDKLLTKCENISTPCRN